MASNRTTVPTAGTPHRTERSAYRPDIDGLRALAVLPVVLFHARVGGFGGGFTGVDVFFVISGFLITSLIAKDLAAGTFSLLHFYERRARRILPALFTVVAASAIGAIILFMPPELIDFGQSVIALTVFASNVLFWLEAGYFDSPGDWKPLLHTWSLAVEEQFYIVFPLVALAWHRRLTRPLVWLLIPALVASFALSAWSVGRFPDATFYLAPARAWELLVGAVLALGIVNAPNNRIVGEAAGIAGLALIAYGVFALSEQSPFPGPNALYPCLGAALVIWSGSSAVPTLTSRALATPPLVGIGLLSYSLYLWHWPALVFYRYAIPGEPGVLALSALLAAMLLLSYLSWRYIEQPVRHGAFWRGWRVAVSSMAGGIACLALGLTLVATAGLPGRVAPAILSAGKSESASPPATPCPYLDAARKSGMFCVRGTPGVPPRFVLVGDSHANVLGPAVFEAATRLGLAGYEFTSSGFRPLPGVSQQGAPQVAELTARFVGFLRENPSIELVVLAGYWELQATGESYRHRGHVFTDSGYDGSGAAYNPASFRAGLERLLTMFPDRKFAIVEDIPSGWSSDIAYAQRRAFVSGGRGVALDTLGMPRDSYRRQLAAYSGILAVAAARDNATLVSLADTLCNETFCPAARDGNLLYINGDHLSRAGAMLLTETFDRVLRENLLTRR
jgi:peptidoglycan/LPS O-acetylase OafA/YrhL